MLECKVGDLDCDICCYSLSDFSAWTRPATNLPAWSPWELTISFRSQLRCLR
jgi:hypothetical protein